MDQHEKMRLRAAAFRAPRIYPGPAGRVLAMEILAWEEFGYRLGNASLIHELVDYILKAELPGQATEVRAPHLAGFITRQGQVGAP